MRRLASLRQDRVIALGALVLATLWLLPLAERLEWRLYDLAQQSGSARRADDDVVVVAIGDASVRAHGAAAWSPARLAAAIQRIAADEPRVIGLAVPLPPEAPNAALDELRMLRAAQAEALATDPTQADVELDTSLARIDSALDPHRPLVDALLAAERVVVALPAQAGDEVLAADPGGAAPAWLNRHRLSDVTPRSAGFEDYFPERLGLASGQRRRALAALPDDVGEAAAAVGFVLGDAPAPVGARRRTLTLEHSGGLLPSFALALATHSEADELGALEGRSDALRLAGRRLVTDSAGRALPYWYPDGERPAFTVHDFEALLAGRVVPGAFQRRTVLVGVTATDWAPLRATPLGGLTPVLAEAHAVAALRAGDLYTAPRWGWAWQLALLGVLAVLAWTIAARLGVRGLVVAALGGVLVLVVSEFLAIGMVALWLPNLLAALVLTAVSTVLIAKRVLEGRSATVTLALNEANRVVAEAMHQKGELDRAFDKYLECPPTDTLLRQMYTLGLDFERKRQFNRAALVFDHIRRHAPALTDAADRFVRMKQLENTVMLGTTSLGHTMTAQLQAGGEARPKLGRYEVERELGKGAMGVVYLGRDPRIGRTVAIKTMPVASEFQGPELEEVKARFFREAETAGRLSHPGVVTVYDAGEETDLCWIAMDYLTGDPLSRYTKQGALLPYDDAFHACIQVAEALDYAHSMKVVHRDIKPGNLMWDPQTKKVRVTDFGVACLTDASKTKTGTILGSPSYMSPEQVSGQHVDGRSDVFALGVTFYQLLTGELPFQAGQLTTLMYKIANEPHPDIRAYNPRLPVCVSAIVNGALHKDPTKRFQTAGKMAEALKACRAQKPAY
jgi:CHASE2 domain-containing sensor protein/tRNA A-37 threonylcarbamoyl transferase component Bud32